MEAELRKPPQAAARHTSQRHATVTYFENGLPVASMPLMSGALIMNPNSYLEIVKPAGSVVIPCYEIEKLTLEELNSVIVDTKHAHLPKCGK